MFCGVNFVVIEGLGTVADWWVDVEKEFVECLASM
jgi:hypothetical protein